ncbi:MAG: MarR family transcriptional regulator [Clostridia bacterium]|jgi:DNA-binding MarR family transcriptional regulator|nr:MarR family transcriptional regulator [Clostridia bacterium]MDH7572433.1 MarR family transcriptional regulator [Clostridia bacterium]
MEAEAARRLHRLLVELMALGHQKFFRAWHKYDAAGGLKKNQMKLVALLFHEGVRTATELSSKLDLEKGSLTSLLDSLEQRGLIRRSINPRDRRQTLVSLTVEGRRHMEKTIEAHQAILMQNLKDADAAEIERLIASLEVAVGIMRKL